MWEEDITDIVARIKKKLLHDEEEVKYRTIVEDKDLPKHIKSLFKIKVKYFFQKESPLEFKSTPHFKLQSDDIKEYKDKLITIFWEGAVFSKNEIDEILKEALVLRLNYLLKPMDTIRRLLFEDQDNISLEKMDQILTSFKNILPYAEIIIKECSRQGQSLIDRTIFSNIATEQLQNIFKQEVVKTVVRDFTALTDFLSEIKGETVESIDGMVLQEFFADRNLWGFRRALEVEMKINGKDFSAQNLEMTVKRYLELKSEFESSKPKEEVEEAVEKIEEKEILAEEEVPQETVKQEESTTGTLDWELEELTEENKEQKKEQKKESKKETEDTITKEKKKNKHMRIIRRDEDSAKDEWETTEEKEEKEEKEEEAPKLDLGLKDLIDAKMEKGFIKKLFDNNSKAYINVIEKLNKAESWREAKVLIDNELFKRDVDPFSREAIKLVDLVYGIFYPEEGVGGKESG